MNCNWCGKDITGDFVEMDELHFCSERCKETFVFDISNQIANMFVCNTCGKNLMQHPDPLIKEHKPFCDEDCYSKYRVRH